MPDNNCRNVCTLDHAGKQRDAIGWNDHRFWLELARRRRAARERLQKERERAPLRD